MEGRVRKEGREDNQARWEMAGPDGESVQYGFLSRCWMIGDCKAPTRIGAYVAISPHMRVEGWLYDNLVCESTVQRVSLQFVRLVTSSHDPARKISHRQPRQPRTIDPKAMRTHIFSYPVGTIDYFLLQLRRLKGPPGQSLT